MMLSQWSRVASLSPEEAFIVVDEARRALAAARERRGARAAWAMWEHASGSTYTDIGRELAVSRSRAAQIVAQARSDGHRALDTGCKFCGDARRGDCCPESARLRREAAARAEAEQQQWEARRAMRRKRSRSAREQSAIDRHQAELESWAWEEARARWWAAENRKMRADCSRAEPAHRRRVEEQRRRRREAWEEHRRRLKKEH